MQIALRLFVGNDGDPVNDHLQATGSEWTLPIDMRFNRELALLESFGPDAITGRLEVQDLHLGFTLVNEDKIMATLRLKLHLIAHLCN